MNAIEASGLTRYYGIKRGVADLDLVIPAGSVYGLLGENGSGKTTTLKLAMGTLVPDRGRIRVLGADPAALPPALRARIGYVADEMEVPDWMTLQEVLAIQASFFPNWDGEFARALLRRFELKGAMVYRELSKGQKRRFILTLIVAQRPELLVLDEPAGGLDVAIRRQFLDLLMEMVNERPMTIVLSSHLLNDVERIVDHVAFIKNGRIIRAGELEELKARVKRICLPSALGEGLLRERFELLSLRREGDALLAVVEDFDPQRLAGLEATVEHLNLEELFLVFNAGRQPVEVA